jgi:hypothetical protein
MFVCNKRRGANSMFLWSLVEFRMDSEWGELVGTIQIEYQCRQITNLILKYYIFFFIANFICL